jgi:UDP-N-acetylglucosamine:LPS N-acetylglucosamine transferase
MLPDDRVVRDLGQEVRHLLNDAEGCATMSKALRAAARPKAATTVANAVIELAHP